MPGSAPFSAQYIIFFYFKASTYSTVSFMYVVMTITTLMPLHMTSAYLRIGTHTQMLAQSQHMHLFLSVSHPTVHTASHSSSRALPFSAPSTAIIVSTPFAFLLRLCSQRDVAMETGYN